MKIVVTMISDFKDHENRIETHLKALKRAGYPEDIIQAFRDHGHALWSSDEDGVPCTIVLEALHEPV
jgi:hypothetical protein